ncbi:hypothetical protein Sa4125_45360 [Aureimonas sp. SA4125]|uniref:hypothetical protein n=1 Tax=Aureimonas sp. SA4125 TaxID=2826993 RepID=UPI001CC43C7A|nr:hypothetical protein [Aureimonas sp. SA4125]BDA86994.1 hypothetical protein Sa4125_45360 [Aureimonas sp. SA4125]
MTDPHVFSRNSATENDRVPEAGQTPRPSDTLVGAKDSPDPDFHAEALANATTDSEAGAIPDNDEGGITPLKPRD